MWEQYASFFMISCWHCNEDESDAMWKIYGHQGIAIKSSLERLKNSIDPGRNMVEFGMVKYFDYPRDYTPIRDIRPTSEMLICKCKCYEHEKELRAMIMITDLEPDSDGKNQPLNRPGIPIKCCADILIGEVYVSPINPEWQAEVVKGLLKKYGLKKDVMYSKILTYPF